MLDERQIILDDSLIAPNDFENVSGSMSRLLFVTLSETQLAPHIPLHEDIGEFGSTGKYSTQRQALPKLDDSNSPINILDGEADGFSQLLVNTVNALVDITEHRFLVGLTEDSYSEFRDAQDKLSSVINSIDNLIKAYEETNIMTAQNRAIDVDYTDADAEWEAAMQLPARGPDLSYDSDDTAQITEDMQPMTDPDDAEWEAAMQLPARGPDLSYDSDDTAQITEDMQTMTDPDDAAADAEWEAAMQLPARGPELTYSYEDPAGTVDSYAVRRV